MYEALGNVEALGMQAAVLLHLGGHQVGLVDHSYYLDVADVVHIVHEVQAVYVVLGDLWNQMTHADLVLHEFPDARAGLVVRVVPLPLEVDADQR